MYFPIGQEYDVIIQCGDDEQYVHEPIGVLPRQDEWINYYGQWFFVNSIVYYYRNGKPQIRLMCTKSDGLPKA